jgi:hypothetical protein
MNIKCFAFHPGQSGCAPSCDALEDMICQYQRCPFFKSKADARKAWMDSMAKRKAQGMELTDFDKWVLEGMKKEGGT